MGRTKSDIGICQCSPHRAGEPDRCWNSFNNSMRLSDVAGIAEYAPLVAGRMSSTFSGSPLSKYQFQITRLAHLLHLRCTRGCATLRKESFFTRLTILY